MSTTLSKYYLLPPTQSSYGGSPGAVASSGYTTTTYTTSTTYISSYSNTPSPGAIAVQAQNGGGYTYVTLIPVVTTVPVVTNVPGAVATAPVAAPSTANYNYGWNGGAVSISSLAGDGYAQFSVPLGVDGVVAGFGSLTPTYDYSEVQFGFYFHTTSFTVIEAGVQKTASAAYSASDVFTVQRSGGTVRYFQNGTLVYTSTGASYGTVSLEAVLYAANDQVLNAALATGQPPGVGYFARSSTAFQPLAAYSGRTHTAAEVNGSLQPLTVSNASGHQQQISSTSLQPLTGNAGKGMHASASPSLQAMTVLAQGGRLTPTQNRVTTAFVPMAGAAHSYTGTITLHTAQPALAPLAGNAGKGMHATTNVSLQPMTVLASNAAKINGLALIGTKGGYTLNATAKARNPNGIAAVAPTPYLLAARTGLQLAITKSSPVGTLNASSTVPNLGRAALSAPSSLAGALSAHGLGGIYATAQVKITQSPSLKAFTGVKVVGATVTGGYTFNGHATLDNHGTLTAKLPMVAISATTGALATGTNAPGARAVLTGPSLQPTTHGWLLAGLPPGYRLDAVGTAVITTTWEAYAMNMQLLDPERDPHAVTHFIGFPFTQILRFGPDYYGVGSDGLYKLGGDTDNGAAIPWAFYTCETDFGERDMKRVSNIYVGGQVEIDLTASVTAEPPENPGSRQDYSYTTQRTRDPQNVRVPTGKGLRSRYYSFGLSDTAGHNVTVDTVDFDVDLLKRGI